jgi:hypothetical protein
MKAGPGVASFFASDGIEVSTYSDSGRASQPATPMQMSRLTERRNRLPDNQFPDKAHVFSTTILRVSCTTKVHDVASPTVECAKDPYPSRKAP